MFLTGKDSIGVQKKITDRSAKIRIFVFHEKNNHTSDERRITFSAFLDYLL